MASSTGDIDDSSTSQPLSTSSAPKLASNPLSTPPIPPPPHASAPASSLSSFWAPPSRLALSTYRRPEAAVRFTDADPTSSIHAKYDLLDPTLCRTLGHGASSTVRLAHRRRDGRPVAIKTIATHDALGLWTKSDRRSALRSSRRGFDNTGPPTSLMRKQSSSPRLDEADVLASLARGSFPHVVQLLDVYETEQEVQLVLEYCGGGDLFDCIKERMRWQNFQKRSDGFGTEGGSALPLHCGSHSEREASAIVRTVLCSLETLHARHIVHRDIKPENILLVDEDGGDEDFPHVKLTDFGLARVLHHEDDERELQQEPDISIAAAATGTPPSVRRRRSRAYSRVGSDYYAAPEVGMGFGYSLGVDVYSLGVTAYVLLCGATPPSPCPSSTFPSPSVVDGDAMKLRKVRPSSSVPSYSEEESGSSSSEEESEEGGAAAAAADRSRLPESDLFPPELGVSKSAKDLIQRMIHSDPTLRITASEALKHEWIVWHKQPQQGVDVCLQGCSSCDGPLLQSRNSSLRTAEGGEALSASLSRIHGSLQEIAPLVEIAPFVVPPSNSPTSATAGPPSTERPRELHVENASRAAVSLTLAAACERLAPLVGNDGPDRGRSRKRRVRQHRHHRRRNHDKRTSVVEQMHRLNNDEDYASVHKKMRVDSVSVQLCVPSARCPEKSSSKLLHHSPLPQPMCATDRIGQMYNRSPVPGGGTGSTAAPLVGPLLPNKNNLAIKGAN